MTVNRALARIMELHKLSPGDDMLRQQLRHILNQLDSTAWSRGYDEGLASAAE